MQKYNKSGSYDMWAIFQVFWSHMIGLCEEKDQHLVLSLIYSLNLLIMFTKLV